MKLITQSPQKALKAFLKQRPLESERNLFKANLVELLDKIAIIDKMPKDESEEHLKNLVSRFLLKTYYESTNEINTKDKKDLVIYENKRPDSDVLVIIEAKRPSNTNEMIFEEKPNRKAIHELILYYLNERKSGNFKLKNLVATNIEEWFIIDSKWFDKYFYSKRIQELHETYANDKKTTPFFYEEVAKLVDQIDAEIPCIHFNIKKYEKILRNTSTDDDKELVALYKILSPEYLLKIGSLNDSNTLDEGFYKELLHIIGLEEVKEGAKNIIRRKKENKNTGSLIELTIEALKTEDTFHRIPDIKSYGENKEEQIYNIALELCITWINRILFLKLLEGQLIAYHQGNRDYRFLNSETIHDYDELFKLFHKVLAVNLTERTDAIKQKYSRVPYLNSSLFEISDLEDQTIKINSIENDVELDLITKPSTVLTEIKKSIPKLRSLDYLFKFLDAYDFASEGTEDWQKDNKQLINASVLGKVFEKINGYRDGSIYTPAFITMYMCRQSIRTAIVEKFNVSLSEKGEKLFDKFEDIKNYTSRHYKTEEVLKANEIINSLRICDPAVGSGHFLVSALNEIIAIKAELGILADEKGNSLIGYEIEVINDELDIRDRENKKVEYKLFNNKPISKEVQRLQKTLFHEKQTIIENCLFGVDINPKSVLICRLRLWIELLKNAYYKEDEYIELETLPNIDINIKCGNSLLSRFLLDADLKPALIKSNKTILNYREAVFSYKNSTSKVDKRELLKIINEFKNNIAIGISQEDKKVKDLNKKKSELFLLKSDDKLLDFELIKGGKKLEKEKIKKLNSEVASLEKQIEEQKNNILYRNAFEWRFEFPEVLNNKGDFEGFDLIIGNPPYIRHEEIKHLKPQLEKDFAVFNSSADILTYFFELGNKILRPKGGLSFIVSNKFFKVSYGDNLRSYLIHNTLLQQIIEFDKVNVFDEATVKAAIIQFKKEQQSKTFTYLDVLAMPENLETVVKEEGKEYEQALFNNGQWIFQSENLWKIYDKISEYGTALSEWDLKINFGIKTGFNEAFLLNEETKNRIIAENKSAEEVIKPLFRGREIDKYFSKSSNSYIIGTFPALKLDIKKYPSVENHLLAFGKAKLEQSGNAGSRKKSSNQWFETQDTIAFWKELSLPKIIWKRIGSKLRFCYDETGFCSLDSTCIATGKHLKYLVGVLNSKLIENELHRFAPKTGTGDLIISVQALSPLQIPIPTPEQESKMNELVDKIIAQKQKGEDTKTNETLIDKMVYELYDLTPEEVDIIEGK
jgi:adenine-specific DNA-methyltransferase